MQFLFWETDEVAIIVIFFIGALLFGGYIGWLLVFIVPAVYRHYKKTYPRGFLRHMIYACGLVQLKGYPEYFTDIFHE